MIRNFSLEIPNSIENYPVTFYEVDKADMNAFKNKILGDISPKCFRVSVDANFAGADRLQKLVEAGFDKNVPTVWVLDGLIYYLSENEVDLLMKAIATVSAPGSVFSVDIMSTGAANCDHPWSSLWKLGVDNPEQFLIKYRWSECSLKFHSIIARERGYAGYGNADPNPDHYVWQAHAKKQ